MPHKSKAEMQFNAPELGLPDGFRIEACTRYNTRRSYVIYYGENIVARLHSLAETAAYAGGLNAGLTWGKS